jgi:hypothetical protein
MERFVDEVGKGRIGLTGGRNPPVAEPAALRADEGASEVCDMGAAEPDSCIAGPRIPTGDTDHRGVLSDIEFPELFEALDEVEQFVRRNPWPMLALGFAAGYWLSRSKAR